MVFGFPLFTALALHSLPSAHGAVIVGCCPRPRPSRPCCSRASGPAARSGPHRGRGWWRCWCSRAPRARACPAPRTGWCCSRWRSCALGYAEGGALSRELGRLADHLLGAGAVAAADRASRSWRSWPATCPAARTPGRASPTCRWSACSWASSPGTRGWPAAASRAIGQVQLAQPVLTLVWAALLLGEHVSPGMVAAALIVLACVVATQRTRVAAEPAAGIGSLSSVTDSALLDGLELLNQGKVRDVYAEGDDRLLMVVSDRISTYDVVHPNPIPDKGKVLTGLTAFWLDRTESIVPNHLISFTDVPDAARGRGMLVEKLEMAPVECVVRGYITGLGLEGLPALRRDLRHRAARRAPGVPAAARAHLHPGHQGRGGRPRRERGLRPRGRDPRRPRPAGGAAPASRSSSTSSAPRTRASAGSSWPTPSSSSAAAPTAPSCWATRCSRPTRRASGPPTATSPATASRASTSSTCATGRRSRAGTSPRPRPSCPTTWWPRRASCTWTPTSGSPASRSRRGWSARA